jgi:hypothetical protein
MAIKGSKVSIVVVYHKDCADGFGAAYAAWKALAERPKYVPVSYDERNTFVHEVEKLTYSPVETLYVVDFSFDLSQLSRLSKLCGRIVVLDHHDTARNELMARGAVKGRQVDDWTTKPEIQRLGIFTLSSTWKGRDVSSHGTIFSGPVVRCARCLAPASSIIWAGATFGGTRGATLTKNMRKK